jgi:NitT/TauT family transport system substrate-binding protein
MRSLRFRSLAASVVLLAASGLSACGGDDDSGSNSKGLEDGGKMTVAILGVVDGAGAQIAQQKKLFEAEGLKVKLQVVAKSTDALGPLLKGQVGVIGGANLSTFIAANDAGQMHLKIISEAATLTPNMMSVLVKPNSSIKTPKDLEGKKVAVVIPNNIQVLTMNAILRAKNVDPTKVKYTPVPFAQMGTALEKDDVDAVHVLEPFLSDIQKRIGARSVLDGGSDPVKGVPVSGYVSTKEWTEKHPKEAAAFQRAIFKAQALAASDRKQVEGVLPTYAHIQPDVAKVITLPGYPTSLNATRINRVVDLMKATPGLLKGSPDLNQILFTPSPS